MKSISYKGHGFPPHVIRQAVWLYLQFTLSLRLLRKLLKTQGIHPKAIVTDKLGSYGLAVGPQHFVMPFVRAS
jgi:putative transposase